LRAGAALAGVLSGWAAGRFVAGAALDLSTELCFLGAACDAVPFLLNILIASRIGGNDLLLLITWDD
jgi:hypothetical protein